MFKKLDFYIRNRLPLMAGTILYVSMMSNAAVLGMEHNNLTGTIPLLVIYGIGLILSFSIIKGVFKHPKVIEITLVLLLGTLAGVVYQSYLDFTQLGLVIQTIKSICSVLGVSIMMVYVFIGYSDPAN